LIPKNGPLGRRPGPGKDGQNNAKTPLLMMFPPEKLKPKTKNFFLNFDYKTCWIHRGFEQLSSFSGWWLFMAKKGRPIYWLARSLRVKNYRKESSNELMLHRHCL